MTKKIVAKVAVLVLALLLTSMTFGSLNVLAAEASAWTLPSDAQVRALLEESLWRSGGNTGNGRHARIRIVAFDGG
jgi:hypothetical protein